MNKKKNSMEFGAYEFFTVSVVCLLLTVILLLVLFKNMDYEKYQVFRYDAKVVGMNASNLVIGEEKDVVYLVDMIEEGFISPIKNPFSGEELCDPYESKVEFLNDTRRVTLKCGDYLIDKQELSRKAFPVYHVSDWSNKKRTKTDESRKVYNCKKKSGMLFDDYYEEGLFLIMLGKRTGKVYNSINDIKRECSLVTKTVYRKKTVVKKVAYE